MALTTPACRHIACQTDLPIDNSEVIEEKQQNQTNMHLKSTNRTQIHNLRPHARAMMSDGTKPSQLAFLHGEHTSLATHLSHDNQKLLKVFEDKQQLLRAMSEKLQ